MSKRPAPRTISLDGKTVVVLAPDEYERLAQARRQVGSYGVRINVVKQQLRTAVDILRDVDGILNGHPPCTPPVDPSTAACLLCGIREAVGGRPADTR